MNGSTTSQRFLRQGARAAKLLAALAAFCACLGLVRHVLRPSTPTGGEAERNPRQLAAAPATTTAAVSAADVAADEGKQLAAARDLLDSWPSEKPRGCIVILARNSDLDGVLSSVQQLERRFNAAPEARYPYIYLNDKPFSAEFRRATADATAAPALFGLVPHEHWSYPPHINQTLAAQLRQKARHHMPYGGSESYRFMCRYYSGFFFDHPLLDGFDFYWRVEPDVHFTCTLRHDPFRRMQQQNASLAWTIVMSEVPSTIPSLWPVTQQWLADHPQYIPPNTLLPAFLEEGGPAAQGAGDATPAQQHAPWSLFPWHWGRRGGGEEEEEAGQWQPEGTADAGGSGGGGSSSGAAPQPWLHQSFTGCHFWSNFEIGRLSFFRGEAYRSYFAHLEAAGGFFYERWGDAPVHTLAAAALLEPSQVLWAKDIGYKHNSWAHCPLEPEARRRCDCNPFYDAQPGVQPSCQLDFLTRLAALQRRRREEGQAAVEAAQAAADQVE